MGLRYYRRVNLGNGLGLNLSKSGVSTSYRAPWGSIGTSGYSIRTGVPGLVYRGGRRDAGLSILLIFFLVKYLFIAIAFIIKTIFYLIFLLFKLFFKNDSSAQLATVLFIFLIIITSVFTYIFKNNNQTNIDSIYNYYNYTSDDIYFDLKKEYNEKN